MKVFISWSGERSQALAQALRDWLPLVLHFADPWLSKSDINAGERWALEIAKELEANQCGIICITRENVGSPWILFESGALAKSMEQGRVIPLLFNIEFGDITGPLAQFQAKKAEKSGIHELITSINRMSEQSVPEGRLAQLFDMVWPSLEEKITNIPSTVPTKHNRPQHEILEELVTGVRGLEMRFRDATEGSTAR
jgi:TIR domain